MPARMQPAAACASMHVPWPAEAAILPPPTKAHAHRPTIAFDLDGTLIGSSDDPGCAHPYGGECSVVTTYDDGTGMLCKRYRWADPTTPRTTHHHRRIASHRTMPQHNTTRVLTSETSAPLWHCAAF